jgi:hypothetical protein
MTTLTQNQKKQIQKYKKFNNIITLLKKEKGIYSKLEWLTLKIDIEIVLTDFDEYHEIKRILKDDFDNFIDYISHRNLTSLSQKRRKELKKEILNLEKEIDFLKTKKERIIKEGNYPIELGSRECLCDQDVIDKINPIIREYREYIKKLEKEIEELTFVVDE